MISAIVRSWDGKITIPAEKGRPVAGNGDEKIFGYVQNLGPVETLNDGRPYNIDPDSGEVFYPAIKGNFYKVYYWAIKPSVEICVVGGDHDLEELKEHIEKLKTEKYCGDCRWFFKKQDDDNVCGMTGLRVFSGYSGTYCGDYELKLEKSKVRPKPIGTVTTR